MPRYLLAEMVNPEPECYDLVIVDEASQLGIDSFFLFYISKKIVVVGDDQQISPYGIGIPDDAIADLQRRYLHGIPHADEAFLPTSSLYGNANIRFSDRNIVLREHFRCMPEIIQFSNDLCYAPNGPSLDPLRTYQENRLEPLVLQHVVDGYRADSTQNAQNPPEADSIVTQIAACIADPRYDKATMGVISLQGEAQAKLVEQKLLEHVAPEDIEKRRLICGDAYTFQGDERDVIFLSMVTADRDKNGKRQRIVALTDDSARQRFNVAASRARDQLWLFHTATLDVLSNPECMRHRLLSYFLNPKRQTTEEHEQRFESEFERDVFRRIVARGFYVRTQVGVGDTTNYRYRIDLVVEGMQGRLAVECDGDHWHGPERYEQDMARQRDLERAGWEFVRIRGSNFYRDPDEAMEPVWTELDRLGIRPGGINGGATVQPPPPSPKDGSEDNRLAIPGPTNSPSPGEGELTQTRAQRMVPMNLPLEDRDDLFARAEATEHGESRQAEKRQEPDSSTSPDMEDDPQLVSEDSATDRRNARTLRRFPLRSDEHDLLYDDRYHVDLVIQLILDHIPSITSYDEMRPAAAVLLALERLPYATPGVGVRLNFSTSIQEGNSAWASLDISDEEFQLGLGEYISGLFGGDTESRTVFFAQAGSDWREGDINEWLSYAQHYGSPQADEGEDSSDYEVIDQFLGGKFAEFVKCVEEGSDYKRLDWFSDLMTDDRGDEDCDS